MTFQSIAGPRFLPGVFMATALVCGCAGSGANAGAESWLRGEAILEEPAPMPRNAQLIVRLVDVTRANLTAPLLGEVRINNPVTPPFEFAIRYDPAGVDPASRYALEAEIRVAGRPAGDDLDWTRPRKDDGMRTGITILIGAAGLLAPGGRIVYSTCSLEAEENGQQVEAWIAKHPGFGVVDSRQLFPPLAVKAARKACCGSDSPNQTTSGRSMAPQRGQSGGVALWSAKSSLVKPLWPLRHL